MPLQDGNNLSGPVPPNWATHPSLQSVFVRPGNPLLCQPPGVDFGFRWACLSWADPRVLSAAAL